MDASGSISNPIIENLCKRYASTRSGAIGVQLRGVERSTERRKASDGAENVVSISREEIDTYRDNAGYVTSDGFTALFRARRVQSVRGATGGTVKSPESSPVEEFDYSESMTYTRVELEDEALAPEAELKYTEAHREARPCFMSRSLSSGNVLKKLRSLFAFLLNTVRDWVEYDHEALRTKAKRKKFPIVALAAIGIMALALFLIVKSSVMLMDANRGLAELKSEIATIEAENALIDSRLEEKYNLSEIERIATEELGMIKSEYATTKYFSDSHDNTVTLYDDASDNEKPQLIATLLSALGLGGN